VVELAERVGDLPADEAGVAAAAQQTAVSAVEAANAKTPPARSPG
jgi:hypothetical protein